MLSIITPIYKESRYLQKYINRLSQQKDSNFEIIFIVDTLAEECLSFIDSHTKDIKGKIRVIFNSKRIGRNMAVISGVREAVGSHIIISSITDVFKDDMVKTINTITSKSDFDIYEFCARFHKPFWFTGEPRTNLRLPADKFDLKKVFAYSYPFEFNKIFKTSILKKVVDMPRINTTLINSRFSIELLFKAYYNATSYTSINKRIIRTRRTSHDHAFNPFPLLREWNKITSVDIFSQYASEIKYNKLFVSKVFFEPMVIKNKSDIGFKKIKNILSKEFDEDFYDSNKYIIAKNKEAELLVKFRGKNSSKLYKEME